MTPAQTNGAPETRSKKRAAAEPVDDEELEKRRKRAERFGLPVTVRESSKLSDICVSFPYFRHNNGVMLLR